MQLVLSVMGEQARRVLDGRDDVANLHLDPDSANLATPILQLDHEVGCQLTQLRGDRSVARGDAQGAMAQADDLAGLSKKGGCYLDEMSL